MKRNDLYVHVVALPDGRIYILDEDELEEAYVVIQYLQVPFLMSSSLPPFASIIFLDATFASLQVSKTSVSPRLLA